MFAQCDEHWTDRHTQEFSPTSSRYIDVHRSPQRNHQIFAFRWKSNMIINLLSIHRYASSIQRPLHPRYSLYAKPVNLVCDFEWKIFRIMFSFVSFVFCSLEYSLYFIAVFVRYRTILSFIDWFWLYFHLYLLFLLINELVGFENTQKYWFTIFIFSFCYHLELFYIENLSTNLSIKMTHFSILFCLNQRLSKYSNQNGTIRNSFPDRTNEQTNRQASETDTDQHILLSLSLITVRPPSAPTF